MINSASDSDNHYDHIDYEYLEIYQSVLVSASEYLNLNDEDKTNENQERSIQFITIDKSQINQNKQKVKTKVSAQKNGLKTLDLRNRILNYQIDQQTSGLLRQRCLDLFKTKHNIIFSNNEPLLRFYQFKTNITNRNPYLAKLCLILAKYYIYISIDFQQADHDNFLKQIELIIDFEQSLIKVDYSEILICIDAFLSGEAVVQLHNFRQKYDLWMRIFESQLVISKGYIKSHICNYRIYVDENKGQIYNEGWYILRKSQFDQKEDQNQRKVDQSKAKKSDFLELLKQEQQKKTNVGRFTIIEHLKQITQNKIADKLLYLDDIFNVIIKYDIEF